jgi:glycosyltransferase involved in cell wall biosynthesis
MAAKKTNKLKIGILVDQLVPGGVQKSAIEEAKNLKTLGHEVILFVLIRLHYDYQYQDLSKGLKVVFLSDYNPRLFRRAIRITHFAFLTHLHLLNPFFAGRYTVLKKLDFIISHGTTTCITAQAISRKLKVPYMAFIWDPMIFIWDKVYSRQMRLLSYLVKPLIRHYERSFLNAAALVATSSRVHQQYIKNVYHVDPIIIHPGCFPPRTTPKKSGQLILGYTRWELAKNPDLFLWLAKKMPKAYFLLAGSWTSGHEEEFFIKKIKRQGLEKRIKLKSPITRGDFKKIASQSLVWVHPNFEAFGMAGLEMAAYGLPIIIPKGSGVTELFEEGKHGFFPSPSNKKAFLSHLRLLLKNPSKASRMGQEAAKIGRRYTWKKHSREVLKFIEDYQQQKKIVCLANAFVATHSIGGGDRFIIELSRSTPKNIHLTIVLPTPGFIHYQHAGVKNPNIRFLLLPQNPFDNQDYPAPLFLAYLIRSIQAYLLLRRLPPFQTLHTATDLFPDSLPAFLFRLTHPEISWASRFFHFIEAPLKREGRLWVNTGSYLLQQLCLRLLSRADLVMIDSPNLKASLKKRGIRPHQIRLHPGGVDTQLFAKSKPHPHYRSQALFIGRLVPHKGIYEALEAWEKVISQIPSARLVMIGYGPPDIKKKLSRKIKKSRLEKNVFLAGYVQDRSKIASYLRSSKLLLFLDHEAGFGLVNVEAMAAGLPVIAYNLPLFGTTFKQGFLSVPLGNTDAVAKRVVEILKNTKKYSRLSQEAKKQAAEFDWSQASQRFFKDLVG